MAQLVALLRDVKGEYSDRGRDDLPSDSVWEMVDWVPEVLQAGARMRGRWTYQQTDALGAEPAGLLYAPFRTGSRLLVAAGSALRQVPIPGAGASTSVGTINPTKQNPVFHRNRVIVPSSDGAAVAKIITFDGTTYTVADAPATSLKGRYATVWKDRVVLGNTALEPQQLAFSKPGDPTVAWDAISVVNTSYEILGLAQQTTQVLVFHASSVERLRGTTPPDSTLSDPTGDLTLDTLHESSGCYDARAIAYWANNVVFASGRGIFLTDGAVVRNVTAQAGMMNAWRDAFSRGGADPLSVAAGVTHDYYVVTLRHAGYDPLTYVVDLPARRMFRLSNIDATAFAYSIGTAEAFYGADAGARQVVNLTQVFDPDATVSQVDADGTPVLPVISSAWSSLSRETGFKRVLDAFVTYEADAAAGVGTLRLSYVNAPNAAEQIVGVLPSSAKYVRRKMPLGLNVPGIGVRLQQLVASNDTRLYAVEVDAYPEGALRQHV